MTHLTDATFDGHLAASFKPVLVLFGAEWCGPTISMWEVFDEAAAELADLVVTASVKVDESPKTTIAQQIKATPTFALFHECVRVGTIQGTLSTEQLVERVRTMMKPPEPKASKRVRKPKKS